MNTRKRLSAMQQSPAINPRRVLNANGDAVPEIRSRLGGSRHAELSHVEKGNPACVIGTGQRCEHALVDAELNRRLATYEATVRGRFTRIVDTLKAISAEQHELDFVVRAQRMALDRLGFELPADLLAEAWVSGLNLRALHSYCIFRSFKTCIDQVDTDQAPWRERVVLDAAFITSCGYHTLDVSPCADGRLQGLLPFVLRLAPNENVFVKAYAGAMFDIESDMGDWSARELERLTGVIPNGESLNYLKLAVYHFSSSHACSQGCAAHGSNDKLAIESALGRLNELRSAIDNTYGVGAAPEILLIGLDTDLDALRIHLPDANGDLNPYRYVDTGALYRDTLGLSRDTARAAIADVVARTETADGWAEGQGRMNDGMLRLVLALAEANLSQIEYVIQHHAGRYVVIGHDEAFICAGEATNYVQMRNKYYYAHLETVEEGAADMDVGVKIFTELNVKHGLAVPVLVHFYYSSRVPGSRARALLRARRVKAATLARYPVLAAQGLINCQMAVSDRHGTERCGFVEDNVADAGH
ncbi:MAG: carboxysome shell carbonic anhydrase [Hydrogenophilales bacterium 12-61-10]|nr:MAG: carboxysome shell carbonic anhydrase [Hydrogenophilales bacterium 12-61-10]